MDAPFSSPGAVCGRKPTSSISSSAATRRSAPSSSSSRGDHRSAAVGQLTGGIAHDFNNILAVIVGMAELTAAGVAGDPKLTALVQEIDQAAERGTQLVQRMLAFARKQPLDARALDLNEAVSRATTMLGR